MITRMRGSVRLACLICLILVVAPMAAFAVGVDDLQARTYTDATGKTMPYRLYVPANYDATKKYPLILFLHGSGERGNDGRTQLRQASPLVFVQPETQAISPCFFIAPQCPNGQKWGSLPLKHASDPMSKPPYSDSLQMAWEIVQKTQQEFSIDPARLYVTGLSYGGFGAWELAERNPTLFAAVIPICGGGDTTLAASLKGMGIWAFHSTDDPTVSVARSRDMIRALWADGQTPNYTEFAMGGHDAWDRAYATPGLANWLFSFHR